MMRKASADLVALLANGAVEEFAKQSGGYFTIRGQVATGDRRGRILGFPTANTVPAPDAPCPAVGVYAGSALGRPAAISVGFRPTFGSHEQPRIEVHILDFDGDLYGQPLVVAFLARLRDERRFNGPTELVAQLDLDINATRQVWASAQQNHPRPTGSGLASPAATNGEAQCP